MAKTLNKRWTTTTSNSRTTADPTASDYVSFEFNSSGNYYIIKADKSMISGTYTLNTVDSLVTLFNGSSATSQYGTLNIEEITDTKLIFRLTLPTVATPIDISTTAITTSVGSSSGTSVNNTTKIAKSWKVDTYTSNNTTYTITAPMYAYVVFTENGTYWTETYNGPGTTVQLSNGQWKWSDATQTNVCTVMTDTTPDCSGSATSISFDGDNNLIMTSGSASNPTIYHFVPLTLN
ncbi:MAG: hypothetical protein ACTHJT_01710 [Cytophaga sp.]|uniref:hypothetical protein n=1 Tax=Cytophaga sp. TaxID=29535 RepID=UPI003F8032EF